MLLALVLLFVSSNAQCTVFPFNEYSSFPLQPFDASLLSSTLAAMSSLLQQQFEQLQIPSLSFKAVYSNTTLLTVNLGIANKTSGMRSSDKTVYRIGSLTKIFTSLEAEYLIEKGVISYETTMGELDPRFVIYSPFKGELVSDLTVVQLGSHMAGLYGGSNCDQDLGPNCTEEQVYARTKTTQLMLPPGLKPQYSNFGFSLLGRGLQQPTKSKYEDFVSKVVLPEYGMSNFSGFAFTPEIVENFAQPAGERSVFADLSFSNPCGGMYSTTADMAEFMKAIFAKGKKLNALYVAPDGNSGIGFPWEMRRYEQGYWSRTKIGNIDGFSSSIEMVPELQIGIIVLTNVEDVDTHTISQPLMKMLFNGVMAAYAASVSQPNMDWSPFVGNWQGALIVQNIPGGGGVLASMGSSFGVLLPQNLGNSSWSFVFRITYIEPSSDSWRVEQGCMLSLFNGLDGSQVVFQKMDSELVLSLPGQTDWGVTFKKS